MNAAPFLHRVPVFAAAWPAGYGRWTGDPLPSGTLPRTLEEACEHPVSPVPVPCRDLRRHAYRLNGAAMVEKATMSRDEVPRAGAAAAAFGSASRHDKQRLRDARARLYEPPAEPGPRTDTWSNAVGFEESAPFAGEETLGGAPWLHAAWTLPR